jgi:hypothetical protein
MVANGSDTGFSAAYRRRVDFSEVTDDGDDSTFVKAQRRDKNSMNIRNIDIKIHSRKVGYFDRSHLSRNNALYPYQGLVPKSLTFIDMQVLSIKIRYSNSSIKVKLQS